MHAVRIVRWALKGISAVEEREAAFMQALTDTTGLYLPVMRVKLEEDFHRERKDETLVRPESVEALKQICLQKIQNAAVSHALEASPHLPYIVWRWRQWAGPEPVQNWIHSVASTGPGALAILRRFVQRQRSLQAGERVARTVWTLRIVDLDPLITLESLEAPVSSLSESDLLEDDREILGAFREALSRKRAGETDDFFRDSESADLSQPTG